MGVRCTEYQCCVLRDDVLLCHTWVGESLQQQGIGESDAGFIDTLGLRRIKHRRRTRTHGHAHTDTHTRTRTHTQTHAPGPFLLLGLCICLHIRSPSPSLALWLQHTSRSPWACAWYIYQVRSGRTSPSTKTQHTTFQFVHDGS